MYVLVWKLQNQDRALKPTKRKKKGGRRRKKHISRRAEKGEKNCHIFAVMGERECFLIGVAMAMVGTQYTGARLYLCVRGFSVSASQHLEMFVSQCISVCVEMEVKMDDLFGDYCHHQREMRKGTKMAPQSFFCIWQSHQKDNKS